MAQQILDSGKFPNGILMHLLFRGVFLMVFGVKLFCCFITQLIRFFET